jgi:hypothetical protein
MAQTINLNKLKEEITTRKESKNINTGGVPPRDTFLTGLIESLNTGRETHSTALVKNVDNLVSEKKGGRGNMVINENVQSQPVHQQPQQPVQPQQQPVQPQQYYPQNDMNREEEMYRRFNSQNKTLAQSIQEYASIPPVGAPMQNNPTTYNSGVQTHNPQMLNEGHLVENIKKVVDGYLVESFAPIVEETIKSTIIEMYAVERIKEVLTENRDLIKSAVIEVIKEIQSRKKK